MKRAAMLSMLLVVGCRASAESLPVEPPPPAPPPEIARAVKLVPFASGFRQPVAMAYAPRDPERRLFVVEKIGIVRVLRDGKRDPTPFLDVRDRVSGATEQGLLGLAFHPKFVENGRFYIYYTDRRGNIRIVEFDRAYHERELLYVRHPFNNHNGGELVFGPDGKLYAGLGDGGWANDPFGNGQNPKALLAKMLRLDVDAPGKPAPQIAAIGVRNPWRFSFDRKTNDLYIADVGQDRWEEIDVVPAGTLDGRNFGWKIMEGLHCRSGSSCKRDGMTLPVVEYNHKAGCSVTGGYVYRGRRLPMLDGVYFYADYCTALVRSFRWRSGAAVDQWDWRATIDPELQLANISTFGEDADGELYVVSLDGVIWKFAPR
ncbi:MAG TPA: PQQ-dependent sugar dehydrogenase [Polyangia bacterium]